MANKVIVSAGFELDGITTLIWGTGGALQSPAPGNNYAGEGTYLVDNLRQAEDSEVEHGTNGTGIKSWRALLKHGRKWDVTVEDDIGMLPPAVGTTVQLIDYLGGTVGVGKEIVYVCKVVDNNYQTARKQPGQRVLQVENLTLIDAQP